MRRHPAGHLDRRYRERGWTGHPPIDAGARLDVENEYGVKPLTLAATNGSAAMIVRLIAGGANPNTALPTGETALMTAARTGQVVPCARSCVTAPMPTGRMHPGPAQIDTRTRGWPDAWPQSTTTG